MKCKERFDATMFAFNLHTIQVREIDLYIIRRVTLITFLIRWTDAGLSPNPLVIIYWPVLRDLWRFILFGVYGYSVLLALCCLDHRPCQEAWTVHSGQCLTRELVSSFCIVWRWSRSWSFDVQSWLSLSGDMLVKTMELSVQDICAFAVYSTIFGLGSNTPKVLRS